MSLVINTSALVAILEDEAERRAFNELIESASSRMISAATLVEAGIVLETPRGEIAGCKLDLFLHRARIQVAPLDADQAEIARAAYRRYGKGRHPASLNLGDCFSYALAISTGEPLLFKGQDFAQTDVAGAREKA